MSAPKIPIQLSKPSQRPMTATKNILHPDLTLRPVFVPVLKYRPNAENLDKVKGWLQDGQLRERYGGMVFTSHRAVEAFAGGCRGAW
jgi:Uroporphyrinogen-III synthase HemD